ncbi:lantibiotic dehydratase [Pendulispora albinea]|uniref:Lantibiotic dehydratase n=1 Tax=Pendulispora albinea TaxID=2741071 RepID=A0ABZ2MC11_9BACT
MIHELEHHGACVVRTPLLPFDVLQTGVTDELLRQLLSDPIVREALFLASPSLDSALDAWLADPRAARAHDAVPTALRYLARMASRPTPFGSFSGCAVARIEGTTSLGVCDRRACRRRSRLDMQYLALVTETIQRDPERREALRYRPNSSLVRAAAAEDDLRYVEAHHDAAARIRRFQLVAVEHSAALAAALEAASKTATLEQMCDAILRGDPRVPRAEARAFVEALIDAQLIESVLQPTVTGEEPASAYARALAAHEGTRAIGRCLEDAQGALAALDEGGLGATRDAYRAIASALEAIPAPLDPARLFQVDLFRPSAGLRLGEGVVREVKRAIDLLHRIAPLPGHRAMRRFRERFVDRYGDREVPLALALDEERGLGFDAEPGATADGSPLLADLAFPAAKPFGEPRSAHDAHKLARVLALLASGHREWQLDDRDLDALTAPDRPPLPDAVAAMLTIAAPSSAAIDRGEFELFLHHVSGPSGASLLARFCHGEPGIAALVERHVRAEETCRPEAAFAEIVHLPEGRLGNILCRPVLRAYEVAYLGASGAPEDRQIALDDLRVCVRRGHVHLRSARLDREVIPRLSSAHNHQGSTLAVYRFLCALQYEGVASGLRWDWGSLQSAPFLPRVRRGRIVVSLATWNVDPRALERCARDPGVRAALGLPRWVSAVERDHVLPLDLERDDAAAQLRALARGRETIRLQELYPEPERLCATGNDGRYRHEIVLPFTRVPGPSPARAPARRVARAARDTAARTFAPGSRWLYVKIEMGPATQDRILRTVLAPLVHELRAARAFEGWFFIRYADPEPHLRLRFQGDPERLLGRVLPRLHERLAPLLASGRVARMQLDTYEREVERYGGPRGMDIAERIFEADSDATLGIVGSTAGETGADRRWRAALCGMHRLLADAKVDGEARRTLVTDARDAFAAEHRLDAAARRSMGARYRAERAAIERWLGESDGRDEGDGDASHRSHVFRLLRARSAACAPLFAELRTLHDAGELEVEWDDIVRSFLHMHVNRVIRDRPRTHELMLYELLLRTYESSAARARNVRDSTRR